MAKMSIWSRTRRLHHRAVAASCTVSPIPAHISPHPFYKHILACRNASRCTGTPRCPGERILRDTRVYLLETDPTVIGCSFLAEPDSGDLSLVSERKSFITPSKIKLARLCATCDKIINATPSDFQDIIYPTLLWLEFYNL